MGTTHQGAPGPPGVPRWVILPFEPPSDWQQIIRIKIVITVLLLLLLDGGPSVRLRARVVDGHEPNEAQNKVMAETQAHNFSEAAKRSRTLGSAPSSIEIGGGAEGPAAMQPPPAVMTASSSEKKAAKRRSGPPRPRGRKSQLALLGGCSPGNAFAPHILLINRGEIGRSSKFPNLDKCELHSTKLRVLNINCSLYGIFHSSCFMHRFLFLKNMGVAIEDSLSAHCSYVVDNLTAILKIMLLSELHSKSICILSANGPLSAITLRLSSHSGGLDNAVYQGQFEIISLKGSYLLSDEGGSGNSNGGLSIMVSTPCGSLFGGSVGGPLIAADPVQVIAGSFNYTVTEEKEEPKTSDSQLNELKVPWELDAMPYEPFSPLPLFGWSRIEDVKLDRHDFDLTNG
uniref:AT-hook motif nuclear-localized protein n=1 Tax=Aegilops tauschii TaxID=37682 RepID=R7W443_AEGTA